MTSFRKCHILQPKDSSLKQDSNLRSSIGGRLGKVTVTPRVAPPAHDETFSVTVCFVPCGVDSCWSCAESVFQHDGKHHLPVMGATTADPWSVGWIQGGLPPYSFGRYVCVAEEGGVLGGGG